MRKSINFLIGLLSISLFLNLLLALSYHDATQDKRQLVNEMCATITLSGISASSRLDEALEASDRRLILMAGIEIEQLSSILESSISKELGVKNTYGPGSLASLAELIIWGGSTNGVSPLGSPNDTTPLSLDEIEMIKSISSALKKLALSFYDESVTENTYMYENRSHSNITAVNRALLTLQTDTESIFENNRKRIY